MDWFTKLIEFGTITGEAYFFGVVGAIVVGALFIMMENDP